MAIITTQPMSMSLLAYLLNSAIRGWALAGLAALGLAAFRVQNTSSRLFTWRAVLYGALAMPLLVTLLPPVPVPAPALLQLGELESAPNKAGTSRLAMPAHAQDLAGEIPLAHAQEIYGVAGTAKASSSAKIARQDSSALIVRQSIDRSSIRRTPLPFTSVASAIYLAVTLFFLMRFSVGLALSRRLVKASLSIADPRVTRRLADRTRSSGIAFVPEAAESECISVPVTVGVLRSKILLPSGWRSWDDAKLNAVIAHELSHIARRDALTQCLSLLHRAIFWFSPLAWWIDRHLADLAEQASDEAALSSGADRKQYARTLLSFFEALHAAPGRVWWQGVSMAKAGQASQRVQRILAWKDETTRKGAVMKGSITMSLKKSIVVAIVVLAIPVVYLVASVRPIANGEESQHVHYAQSPTATSSDLATQSEADTTPDPALAPSTTGTSTGIVSATPNPHPVPVAVAPRANISIGPVAAAAAAGAPVAAAAPVIAPHPALVARGYGSLSGPGSSYSSGSSYQYGYDDEVRFVIGSGNSDSFTMSGSTEDAIHAEKLRKQISGDFIWFERDEKSYIIRDRATIDRAKKLWAPQEELGKKQEELGKQQEALGEQQEKLGAEMEQIQVKVPDMTAELDKLRAELKQLSSGATVEQVGDLQSEVGELQSKIGEVQSMAGDQQSKVGEQQSALGEKQSELGKKQGELGRQQGELAKQANRKMKQLLDEAIKNGTAQREPDSQ